MIKVGYIGLGLMGKNIARNILKTGFPLAVHNRRQARLMNSLPKAHQADLPGDVACQVDVVFTNLPNCPDVEKVALGPENGVLDGASTGLILVDNSTIKPASAREIARR